tara:strand:- start:11716 stop:12432 length:717 start_codon:yes stop_codon:yes gene_type:complete
MYSVVIPLHNEEGNIINLIDEIESVFRDSIKKKHEIVLVDDASTDKTAEIISEKMKTYPAIVLLQHNKKAGQSRALKTGIERARFDTIITLDGDGQNNPADIPDMIEGFHKQGKTGLVIGWRQKRQDSGLKTKASRAAFKARQWFLNDDTPDTGCGLKVFNRDLFMAMPFFNHIHRYMPVLTKRFGQPVNSIEISHRARGAGQSNYGNWDRFVVGIMDVIGVRWLMKRYDPTVDVNEL